MAATGLDAERRSAELRKKVEYQVACEERAHRIVERLIDNPVTQEQLINALHYVTKSHYCDIVEERAVLKLCGYPLCPDNLADIPKQKYMISTKTNKVYDIESRKNFCSAKCYKASKHLECQVSTDPLWSRKNVRPTLFDILPLDMKRGKIGDEVVVSKAGELREDLGRLEKIDKYQKNLAERIHEHNREEAKLKEAKNDKCSENARVEEGSEEKDSVVYTLDKAMTDMNIEDNNAQRDEGQSTEMPITSSVHSGNEKPNVEQEGKDTGGKDGGFEESSSKIAEKTTDKQSKKSKVATTNKAKTDYLMQLLDKRKALLAKMADIQNDTKKSDDEPKQSSDEVKSENTDGYEHIVKDAAELKKEEVMVELSEDSTKTIGTGEGKSIDKTYCKTVVEKRKERESVEKASVAKDQKEAPAKDQKEAPVSILDLMFSNIQSWITGKTVEYLKIDDGGNEKETSQVKTEFEKRFQALADKVDAQERDLDGLLGEESMDPEFSERPSAPLPHFDVLREELEADELRVSEFMKGSFTYKVTEKQPTTKETDISPVVLPTVDRFDQRLIRQRIVLERISKVLPDVLSPLRLLVQDVFTDVRQLVNTFNLTSDNIMYKPAEWTVITVILLRMLSRKLEIVKRSFTSPGAEKFFNVLLSTLKTSVDIIDQTIDKLLKPNLSKTDANS